MRLRRATAGRAALGLAASVSAVALLLRAVDGAGAVQALGRLDLRWLALPLAAVLGQFVIRTQRWRGLLAATSGTALRFTAVGSSLAVGYLGNAVLPARLGEVARVLFVSRRHGLSLAHATASVVLERMVDVIALASLVVVVGGLSVTGAPLLLLLLPASAGLLVGARWMAPRLRDPAPAERLARLRQAANHFLGALVAVSWRALLAAYALSVLAWLGDTVVVWSAGRGLDIALDPVQAMGIGIAAALSTALPSAGGYVGTYELAVVAVGVGLGIPAADALSLAIVSHVVAVVPPAVTGVVVLARSGRSLAGANQTTEPSVAVAR